MPEMGERWSGETSSLILYPPTEMQASYLDFSLRFINVNMIKNIACCKSPLARMAVPI